MAFNPDAYGAEVAGILALDGKGERRIPLVASGCSHPEAAARIRGRSAWDLFPGTRSPKGALAGLWTYFSAFDEAHSIAQDLSSAEGSYWHAILHRQEPDTFNAGYWFRRVGSHPVYDQVRAAARDLGYDWEPLRFVEHCAQVPPGSPEEDLAVRIQLLEWQFLFDYCAR